VGSIGGGSLTGEEKENVYEEGLFTHKQRGSTGAAKVKKINPNISREKKKDLPANKVDT